MSSYSATEVDERAFGLFLSKGLQFFLDEDLHVDHGDILQYTNRLWRTWIQMTTLEKEVFVAEAREQLARLRGHQSDYLFRRALQQLGPQQN
jgi:hypothetical protein